MINATILLALWAPDIPSAKLLTESLLVIDPPESHRLEALKGSFNVVQEDILRIPGDFPSNCELLTLKRTPTGLDRKDNS